MGILRPTNQHVSKFASIGHKHVKTISAAILHIVARVNFHYLFVLSLSLSLSVHVYLCYV